MERKPDALCLMRWEPLDYPQGSSKSLLQSVDGRAGGIKREGCPLPGGDAWQRKNDKQRPQSEDREVKPSPGERAASGKGT